MKDTKPAVCVCPSFESFRGVEIIARTFGYMSASERRYDTILHAAAKKNPSKTGKYLLYLENGKRLSWDHDGIGCRGQNILAEHLSRGYVRIDTAEQLFNYLDNPPVVDRPVTIPLTDDYSAVVNDKEVVVGCQHITHAAVLKVAAEINRRSVKNLADCCGAATPAPRPVRRPRPFAW